MVAIKLLFLTVFTLVNLSNGVILEVPKLLIGAQREAAIARLNNGLQKVFIAGGPEYKVKNVLSVTNKIVSGLSVDTYDVNLINKGTVKQCEVKIKTRPLKPGSIISIRIVCNRKLEYEAKY